MNEQIRRWDLRSLDTMKQIIRTAWPNDLKGDKVEWKVYMSTLRGSFPFIQSFRYRSEDVFTIGLYFFHDLFITFLRLGDIAEFKVVHFNF